MCEYCGCQSITTVADLTREHDDLVTHISVARGHLDAGRTDAAAAVCRDMLGVLGLHTRVEEEGLFPLLNDEFPDHVLALRAEHTRIEDVLGEAAHRTPTDPSWPDRLRATFHLLRDHILKEQDGMFPAALIALDGEQWQQVEAVRARAEREIAERDRDPAGRARQARPRDALGRPLPYGDPRGVEPVPEQALPIDEALTTAQALLDGGRAFSAHEVLEAVWKAAPPGERDLWQGLAQLCVGITHAQRGNRVGATRLVQRATGNLRPFADDPPHGIDVAAILRWCERNSADPQAEALSVRPLPVT